MPGKGKKNGGIVMIDTSSLTPEEYALLENLISSYELARRFGADLPDVESKLTTIDNASLVELIRDEVQKIDAFYKSYEAERSTYPSKYGEYYVIKHVAVGGFATIFRGTDQENQAVAIKVPHYTLHIGKSEELEQEAKILQSLSHENIVEYIDSGWDENGAWYIVTEWIQGRNLEEAIGQCELTIDLTLQVMTQVASAIAFGHEQGIIHRDLNPRNIMLRADGGDIDVKVLDYGLAKEQAVEIPFSGHVRGTPEFMAPEQLQGDADVRSDIYAMGRIAREMLRRHYPDRWRIPRPVRNILEKAAHAIPERRYQSTEEFKSALCHARQLWDAKKIPEFAKPLATKPRVGVAVGLVFMMALFAWSRPVPPPSFDPSQPVASYYNSSGQAYIGLAASPPTASLYAYPIRNGQEPTEFDKIFLGTGEAKVWLDPCYYLIVAVWPDGSFHEVLRTVPYPDEHERNQYRATAFKRMEFGLRLREICRPSNSTLQACEVCSDSLLGVCDILEARGRRLPFFSELTSLPECPIWTLNKNGRKLDGTKGQLPIP